MAGNTALNKAAQAKEDEFYTQLSDIEKELRHYTAFFCGKVVFCNCDDPYESNFFKYFAMNFNSLGLKKLITTCYATSPVAGKEFQYFVANGGQLAFLPVEGAVPVQSGKRPYKVEITEVTDENSDGRIDLVDVEYLMRNKKNTMTLLDGDGDFRSPECVELLKEADIVVTNPPFSLFRDFVAQLMEFGKKFVLIGPQNATHYKEIFPMIRDNKLWLGYMHGDMSFTVPDYYEPRETRYWVDDSGQKWRSMGNMCWFTNLDIEKRHEDLLLFRAYTPEQYPHYENFDAIDVGTIADIPCDYFGMMGVPDTFLNNYNPAQFEIIGIGSGGLAKEIGVKKNYRGRTDLAISVDGKHKCPYSRIVIRRRK